MEVRLIAHTVVRNSEETPQDLMEFAGRVCYNTLPAHSMYDDNHGIRKQSEFIRARLESGHESIIEHVSFTFDIEGISRACSHQLVRHRIASYSQESQRYVAFDGKMVVPPTIAGNPEATKVWQQTLDDLETSYNKLRQLGIPKEDARFLLPNAAVTRLVTTMNCRELRHFFSMRLAKQAQWEIKALAWEMLKLCYPIVPDVFGDIWNNFNQDGHRG